MASITPLHVRLNMDAANFSQGTEMARGEVNKVARVMQQSVPPAQKYQEEVERLNKAFNAAGRQTKEYQNAIDHLKRKYNQAEPAAKSFKEQLKSVAVNPAFLATAAGIAGITAATVKSIDVMRDAQAEIDKTAKEASKLGLSYNELKGLQFAAGEFSGDGGGAMVKSFQQLQLRVAKAMEGDKKIEAAFAKIGLRAGEVMSDGPLAATKKIAAGLEGLQSHGEKLNAINEIYGKQGMEIVSTLTAGADAIQESIDFQQKWNSLTDAQVANVQDLNDTMARFGVVVDGVTKTFAADMAPTVHVIANDIARMVSGFDNLNDQSSQFSFMMAGTAGNIADIAQGIAALSFGSGDDLTDFLTSESRQSKYISEVLKMKEKAENEATQRLIERNRVAASQKVVDELKAAGQIEEAEFERLTRLENMAAEQARAKIAADKVAAAEALNGEIALMNLREANARELLRLRKEAQQYVEDEKQYEKNITSALKSAEQFFEKERQADEKRRQEVAKGPGSGIEAGSAQAAKFMADQVNASIGAAAVPEKPTPGEAEIAKKAAEMLVAMNGQIEVMGRQEDLLGRLVEWSAENGFRMVD